MPGRLSAAVLLAALALPPCAAQQAASDASPAPHPPAQPQPAQPAQPAPDEEADGAAGAGKPQPSREDLTPDTFDPTVGELSEDQAYDFPVDI